MTIPTHLFYDINSSMYLIVDDLYRSIFEDEWEYKITDKLWNVTYWTKFEKYYTPNQVYWYIKVTIRWRMIDFIKWESDREIETINSDREWISDQEVWDETNNEMLVNLVLSKMLKLQDLDKAIFIYVYIKQLSLRETKSILKEQWINVSMYRIRRTISEVMESIKESMNWVDLNEFLSSQ